MCPRPELDKIGEHEPDLSACMMKRRASIFRDLLWLRASIAKVGL
jgi:hypothetical protein